MNSACDADKTWVQMKQEAQPHGRKRYVNPPGMTDPPFFGRVYGLGGLIPFTSTSRRWLRLLCCFVFVLLLLLQHSSKAATARAAALVSLYRCAAPVVRRGRQMHMQHSSTFLLHGFFESMTGLGRLGRFMSSGTHLVLLNDLQKFLKLEHNSRHFAWVTAFVKPFRIKKDQSLRSLRSLFQRWFWLSVLRQGTPQMAHPDLATQQLQMPQMSVPKTMVPKTHLSGETREAEASNFSRILSFWFILSINDLQWSSMFFLEDQIHQIESNWSNDPQFSRMGSVYAGGLQTSIANGNLCLWCSRRACQRRFGWSS